MAADTYCGFFLGPGNGPLPGIDQTLTPCTQSGGTDGYWFDIRQEAPMAPYSLYTDPTLQVELWFYGAGCNPITSQLAPLPGSPLIGNLPAGTEWVLVDNYAGMWAFSFVVD